MYMRNRTRVHLSQNVCSLSILGLSYTVVTMSLYVEYLKIIQFGNAYAHNHVHKITSGSTKCGLKCGHKNMSVLND